MTILPKHNRKSSTRGEIEAAMTEAIIKFEKEYLGRGPLDARTFLVNDMILIRLRGVLTPAEQKVAESWDGRSLVKEARRQLFESSRPLLEAMVEEIVGCRVISLHTDVSTRTGERVIIFSVDTNLDQQE
jgi:uncharacterized protein YbcI